MTEKKTTETSKKTSTIVKKLCSIKFWVTVWCMVLVSYVIFSKQSDFISLVMPLSFAPLAYCGLNVWQKKILSDNEKKEADNEQQ